MIDHAASNEIGSGANGINFTSSINWGMPVFEDELSYYSDGFLPINGRDAWTLSSINLPHGGSINIQYEQDKFDINNDRLNWRIPDYCLPEIGYYNNMAVNRSILQQVDNEWENPLPSWYTGSPLDFGMNLPRLNNEYYFFMNENTGGLRIKKIDYVSNFGAPTVSKTYQYGTGHYTAPPADYWENYTKGFSDFMYNEFIRHGTKDAEGYLEIYGTTLVTLTAPIDYSEYETQMMRLNFSLRVDQSYRKNAKHYYEYIDEITNDNAKTRWYYGALNPDLSSFSPRLVYLPMKYGLIKYGNDDRQNNIDLLSTDLNDHLDIGKYKTEYYNALGDIVKSDNTDYVYNSYNSNTLSLSSVSMVAGDYFPYAPLWLDALSTDAVLNSSLCLTHNAVGLQAINGDRLCPFPLCTENQVYSNIPSWVLLQTQYCSSISDPNVQAIPQAQNPFTKMAAQCGLFTTTPSWFTNITSTPKVWSGIYTDAVIASNFKASIEANTINPNKDVSTLSSPHTYFLDLQLTLPSTTSINQLSKSLLPSHTQTINKYY
jgi:hypothetical protein